MTERYNSYNAKDDMNQVLLDIEETKDFYFRAASLLVYAGYDGEYVKGEIARYMQSEDSWMEGKRDYRILFESFVGNAIAYKLGIDQD